MVFQALQMRRPQLAIRLQPLIEISERLGPDPVHTALRVHPRLDQPRISKHPQVLRDGRLAEPQILDELPNRSLAIAKQLEDREPARLSEHLKRGKLRHTA